MSYDNGTMSVYRFPAASVIAAATLGRIIGPRGKKGRLVEISYIVTTGVTVAASNVIVGLAGTLAAYGTRAVAVAAADTGNNGATLVADHSIPANTIVTVGSAGGATAGAVDILVTILWE